MIKIAFFDVGETLIHDGQPFPAVTAALAAIAGFETSAGEPLILSIISDYLMPDPPRTEEKILALEKQYRDQVLGPSGLSGFFQPYEAREHRPTSFGPRRHWYSTLEIAWNECINPES